MFILSLFLFHFRSIMNMSVAFFHFLLLFFLLSPSSSCYLTFTETCRSVKESRIDLTGQYVVAFLLLFFFPQSSGCELNHHFSSVFTRFVFLCCFISKISTRSTHCQQGTVETFKLSHFINLSLLI